MVREPQTEQARDEMTDCLRDWEVSASARVVVGSRRVRDSDGRGCCSAGSAGGRSGPSIGPVLPALLTLLALLDGVARVLHPTAVTVGQHHRCSRAAVHVSVSPLASYPSPR